MQPTDLTIAIPTFDRPDYLVRTLGTLLPQLPDGVRLLILDNHSAKPASELVASEFGESALGRVEIIRHRVNIGGNANICRCFELCASEWLWILGDDDGVVAGGILRLLSILAGVPSDTLYLNFANGSLACERQEFTDPEALLGASGSLGNLICLPMCVFRIGRMRPYVRHAYQWLSTCAPQLVLVLQACQEQGGRMILLRECLRTDHPVPPFRGSGMAIAWCTAALPHLPFRATRLQGLRRLVPQMITPTGLIYEVLVEVRRGRLSIAQAVSWWSSIAAIKYGFWRRPFEAMRFTAYLLRFLAIMLARKCGLHRPQHADETQLEDRT